MVAGVQVSRPPVWYGPAPSARASWRARQARAAAVQRLAVFEKVAGLRADGAGVAEHHIAALAEDHNRPSWASAGLSADARRRWRVSVAHRVVADSIGDTPAGGFRRSCRLLTHVGAAKSRPHYHSHHPCTKAAARRAGLVS